MSGFDYIAMDEKLKPVAKLMLANRFQLAIDRLQQLVADGIFLPEEMWRVDQRFADCYFDLNEVTKAAGLYWHAITHPGSMPYKNQTEFYSNYLFILHYDPCVSRELLRERHHRVAGTRLDAPRGLIELYRIHPITSCTSSACISGCLPWPASRPSQASA